MGGTTNLGDFFADGIGLFGAALIVIAYFLLQTGRIDSLSLSFSVVNALGAAAILVSLLHESTLGAFAIESFWLIISVYGMYRALQARKALRPSGLKPADD